MLLLPDSPTPGSGAKTLCWRRRTKSAGRKFILNNLSSHALGHAHAVYIKMLLVILICNVAT